MRLVLHIGLPKSGSTALQQWLAGNRKSLSDRGVAVVESIGRPNNIHLAAYFGGAPESWMRRHGVQDAAQVRNLLGGQGLMAAFESEIRTLVDTHHTIVVTSEQFAAISRADHLEELRDFLTIQSSAISIVGYFRWQDSRLPAGWSTAIRGGSSKSLHSFVAKALASDRLNYQVLGDRWQAVFGRENLRFYEYIEGAAFDVRRHFANEVLALPESSDLAYPPKRQNSSLSQSQVSALRWMNRIFPYWRDGHTRPNPRNLKLRSFFLPRLAGRGGPIQISEEVRERVLNHYAESNEVFRRSYLEQP